MYRFGFNTQERTDEIAGFGNHNTALFWEYDTRLGRRWNLDPKYKARQSAFSAFSNNPLIFIDPNGDWDYYSKAGNWLGKVGEEEGMRIISIFDWKALDQKCATPKEYEDVSAPLRVEDECQSEILNTMVEQTNRDVKEYGFYIVIDYTDESDPVLRFEANTAPSGDDYIDHQTVNFQMDAELVRHIRTGTSNRDCLFDYVIVGEVHGHPEKDKNGDPLKKGVSTEPNKNEGNDLKVANSLKVTVFAVDKENIHMVDRNGKVTDGLDKNTDILRKALETKNEK